MRKRGFAKVIKSMFQRALVLMFVQIPLDFVVVASRVPWETQNYWLRDWNTEDAYRQGFWFKGVFFLT